MSAELTILLIAESRADLRLESRRETVGSESAAADIAIAFGRKYPPETHRFDGWLYLADPLARDRRDVRIDRTGWPALPTAWSVAP